MARVFTTSFEYNHQKYDAIVTVLQQGDQLQFNVKLLDADLHQVLPNGEVAYVGTDGFEQLKSPENTLAQTLIRVVGDSIQKHLTRTW